ncbi:2-amino-4-hydroxy-6-hydroxymethyldihydropteridine diphosphokinase [Alicyclobacillus cycloheptanicus]|uniref:2-amino-4-hydroxy-6-hydroxymethyldihydropteridine diphosphokinase n=1 Tax=Alicyclobacillus cycloheptanicus TaxID=1457 RepID=A0ABT9XIJ1_9BACL|nr:2-amino-4-hydroxy-6-hydroxymethyldihydropteridine diphosphokinase [Alicyclobacillus cycloheptanicus]MDQ0190133.1 2-amino-4-hydroxy-6-hydroxymethyldihydropteridine diphosphokinase [Alicyclobacillus cycloheptanicus]WDM02611.1 2-amino-4-hydroxy-6-hydroxymethyldihydropteridine diphosphokinase [Alicyclobacillus cycloheptanicus]
MQTRIQDVHEVYIGIGSNVGSRETHLRTAVRALQRIAVGAVQCSGVYETAPVGYANQPDFLNMVVRMQVPLRPLALLAALHQIEQEAGRTREIRFGPRTLDLDILLFDNDYICYRMLQVPHPRMWDRAFVLVPLAELAPMRRGRSGCTIGDLAAARKEMGIRYVGRLW